MKAKAKKVKKAKKTKPVQRPTIQTMGSEDLALALNQAYVRLMGAKTDIDAINTELRRRQKGKTNDSGNKEDV